ncbi:hypothetical protein BU17DRAFT_69345 [Hysterangium stoloniferum]|nr:hypothetical protein BU17DRAFT_69345 [Hysterangium stoloniferum]
MQFSIIALLACIASLVHSAPSTEAVATNISERAAVTRATQNTTANRLSQAIDNFNPVTETIPSGIQFFCSATAYATFTQRLLIKVNGNVVATYQGQGENVTMKLSSGGGDLFQVPA